MQPLLLLPAARVPLQRLVEAVGVDMTLWQLLILICIAVPVGPALASAQHGRVGPGGYALAIAVGLAVGACCGWVMYATHETVGGKLQRLTSETSPAKQEWYFFGFYLDWCFGLTQTTTKVNLFPLSRMES